MLSGRWRRCFFEVTTVSLRSSLFNFDRAFNFLLQFLGLFWCLIPLLLGFWSLIFRIFLWLHYIRRLFFLPSSCWMSFLLLRSDRFRGVNFLSLSEGFARGNTPRFVWIDTLTKDWVRLLLNSFVTHLDWYVGFLIKKQVFGDQSRVRHNWYVV